jgi:ATP-dependent DNA helicase RecQ
MVATGKTIDEMARFLPQTLEELGKIGGFGEAKIERYGQDFLDIIVDYCKERGLGSLIHERAPKRLRKPGSEGKDRITDTKAESFRLYREGLSVSEIARERRLTAETIEGHLAFFVSQGKININELVSKEKLVEIDPVIKDYEGGPITPIKERLGKDIGFGDIRLALAWKEYEKSRSL